MVSLWRTKFTHMPQAGSPALHYWHFAVQSISDKAKELLEGNLVPP